MLTISQLAATAGVTVRTVRHYHHVGLLPEPGRDASGYRRYSAQAAVDLIRIRTLTDAGVPLGRVDAVLHAHPAKFVAALAEIDDELRRKIDQLAEHRRRIAALAAGDRLVLPAEVVATLDRMRGLGVTERTVCLERDARILMQILDPSTTARWVLDKNARFDDPEKTRLYLACDQVIDLDPHDQRVERLVDELDAWQFDHVGDISRPELELLDSLIAESSPAWRRILEELSCRARRRTSPDH